MQAINYFPIINNPNVTWYLPALYVLDKLLTETFWKAPILSSAQSGLYVIQVNQWYKSWCRAVADDPCVSASGIGVSVSQNFSPFPLSHSPVRKASRMKT